MQEIKLVRTKMVVIDRCILKHSLGGNLLITETNANVTISPSVMFISRAIYLLNEGVPKDVIMDGLVYPAEELPDIATLFLANDKNNMFNMALTIKEIVDEVSRDVTVARETIHNELALMDLAEVESVFIKSSLTAETTDSTYKSPIMTAYLKGRSSRDKEMELASKDTKLEIDHTQKAPYPEIISHALNGSPRVLSLNASDKEQVYKTISTLVNRRLHSDINLLNLCNLTEVIDSDDCFAFARYIEKALGDQLEMTFLIEDYTSLFEHAKGISFSYFPGLKHDMTLEEWMLYQSQLHAFYEDNIIGVSIDMHNDVTPPMMSKHKLNHVDKLTITINKNRIDDSITLLIANARYHGISVPEEVLRYAITRAIDVHLAKTKGL